MMSARSVTLRVMLVAAALVALRLSLSPARADAAVPGTMSYQGRLGGAAALPDSFSMTFKIFAGPAGGTALWTEDHDQVYVDASGLFEVTLGGLGATSFPSDGSTPYLEITVNGETLSPRKPLNTVPYAFVSATGAGPRVSSVTAGQGLTGGGTGDSVTVNVGAGPGITVSGDQVSLDTSFTDALYVGEGQPNSVSTGMIAPPILSSIDSLTNDGGNIDLVAGTNVRIDHPTATSIRISADTSGTSVQGVLPGNFIVIPDSAGSSPRIYLDSLRTDARYVNEGQASSVTTGMIVPAILSSIDGIQNDGGDVDLVAGSNISIDHPSSTTIRISGLLTGGQIDTVLAGDFIKVTDPGGPVTTVALDTATVDIRLDARYVGHGEAAAVGAGMIAPDVVGNTELQNAIALDSLDTRIARAQNLRLSGTAGVDGIAFPDGSVQTTAATPGHGGSGAAGQVTFWSGPSTLAGDNGLVWDGVNRRLGIGIPTPAQALHVAGAMITDKIFDTSAPTLHFIDPSSRSSLDQVELLVSQQDFGVKIHNAGAVEFLNVDTVSVGSIRADPRASSAIDMIYDARRSHIFTTQGPPSTTRVIDCEGNARFVGDLSVIGTLTKGAGSFKIDHPLDPANKYLSHSFVESPDMMNIYNGNAVLDAGGRAWVELPGWFEALNQEFRYQLTAIGGPGPNLYIATEVANHRFEIAGGAPGMKVSWQVTGIRHDPYAVAHRIPVEEEKPAAERGHFLHPELYDQASAGVSGSAER